MTYAEEKIFCICMVVYEIYEGNEYNKIYEALSTLKNKKLEINIFLIEKSKNMLESSDFEQNYWSRTAIGIYKFAHDSNRLLNWICYYDRSHYENIT